MSRPRGRQPRRHHIVPLAASCLIGASALAMIVYLLWPTRTFQTAGDPDRLPVVIGDILFNVPTGSIRVKLQKRTGADQAGRGERNDVMAARMAAPGARRHGTRGIR